MSRLDDQIAEGFPNAEQRATRKSVLIDRLSTFLDTFIESEEGGWATVSREDQSTLYDIFGEIIDLKVGRDGDGDRSITVSLEDRRVGRLHAVYETYSPEYTGRVNPEEALRWLNKATRESAYAMSVAATINRNVESFVTRTNHEMDEAEKRAARVAELLAIIPTLEDSTKGSALDAIEVRLVPLMKELGQEHVKDFAPFQAEMAERFPVELAHGIKELCAVMDEFESDRDDYFYSRVVVSRLRMARLFGAAFTHNPEVVERAERLSARGREIRLAKQAERTKHRS